MPKSSCAVGPVQDATYPTADHTHPMLNNSTGFAPNPTEPERNDCNCLHELSTETPLLSDYTPDSTNPVHEPCYTVYDYTNHALDFTTEGSCSTTFNNSVLWAQLTDDEKEDVFR